MRAEKITSLIFSFQNLFACYLNQQKVTWKTSHKLWHKTFWSQIMGWSWHKGYIICRIQNKVLHHMLTLFLLSYFLLPLCERVLETCSPPTLIFMKHNNTLSLSQCFDGFTTKRLLPIQLWFEWAKWMNNSYIFPRSTLCQQKVWVIIKAVEVRFLSHLEYIL